MTTVFSCRRRSGQRFYEIRPTGSRPAAFDATPKDEIPEAPCGAYGWSTRGVRYFVSDLRTPEVVVFVDVGQDGDPDVYLLRLYQKLGVQPAAIE